MAIPSFFHPDLCESDSNVDLQPEEAAHALKSRRLKVGQPVRLLNGQGLVGNGQLQIIDKKRAAVKMFEFTRHDRPAQQLTVAAAVPKGDRQKVMLDMLTQSGCAKIVPIQYEYSVTKFSDKLRVKWQRAVIESCKQSQNPWVPEVADSQTLDELLACSSDPMMYADAEGVSMRDCVRQGPVATVLIGPEGGFSPQEYEYFRVNGLIAVRLGPHILRTEAAAVVAAAQWVQLFNT